MISYPLVLNKLQLCILNNQRIPRVKVPSDLLLLIPITSYSCLHGLVHTTPFQQERGSLHPSVLRSYSPPASRNGKVLSEGRQFLRGTGADGEKRDKVGSLQ